MPNARDSSNLIERQQRFLAPGVAPYYQHPLVLDRGQGCFVYDPDGNKYLDFFAGILTVSVGHAHPEVTRAVVDQISQLVHTSTLYVTQPMVELASRLAAITPEGLMRSFFTSSGSEANETAIAMARLATGNHEVVALRHGYSGRSSLAMSLTGQASWRLGLPAVPGIVHAKTPYYYRSSQLQTEAEYVDECLCDLEETIATATSGRIAAVLAEPILGVGGFITLPDGYLREVGRIARKAGGLLIVDEVQTGFGRTGKWFGVEHHGVTPDIMTFAKGLANGFPIGATIATDEVARKYTGPTISTFGGNLVSMRAALATLGIIEADGLVDNARVMGLRLLEGLHQLQHSFPVIGDVRGKGLMIGVELVHPEKRPAPDLALRLLELAREEHLLLGKGGLYGNVLRIAPPLNVQAEHVEMALSRLERAFAKLH